MPMKKIIVTMLVALFLPMNLLFGQSYSALWQQVRSAQEKDLPQTEQQALRKIVQKARKERAYGQLLKGGLSLARSEASVSPDSLQPAIERLADEVQQQSDPVLRAVGLTVLAELYKQNTHLYDDGVQRARRCYDEALAHPEQLAAVRATDYDPFVVKGDDSRYYGHDLLSIVAAEAQRYDVLHDYYLTTPNREAQLLSGLDLLLQQRPEGTHHWGSTPTAYAQRLDSLAECYADLDVAAEAAIQRYGYMADYTDATPQQKVAFIDQTLSRWPRWKRMGVLRNARNDLTALQFRASLEARVGLPQQAQTVRLTDLRGISTLTMKVYSVKADGELDLDPQSSRDYAQLRKLLTPLPALTQERHYSGHADYELYDDSLLLPGLPVGVYLIEMSSQPATEVSRSLLFVSDVRLLMQPLPGHRTRLVALNATTGQPLPGARMQVNVYGAGKSRTMRLTADRQGECLRTLTPGERLRRIVVTTAADNSCPPYNGYGTFSYYDRADTPRQVALYTDRAIYRPGQTVHVAAIVYDVEHGYEHKAVEGYRTVVAMRDANWKEAGRQEVVTDRFGTCTADIVLPRQTLTGQYTVMVDGHSVGIRVEEYKRPTFEVAFSKYESDYRAGDTVAVSAVARSYSGVPVQGARVHYKVERRRAFWWMSYSSYWRTAYMGTDSDDVPLAEGDAVTSADGTFEVRVPLSVPASLTPMFYNFVVTADVTDQGGETHQGQLSLPLGNRATVLTADLPEKVQREQLPSLVFHQRNAAGADISTTVRYQIDGGRWQTAATGDKLSLEPFKLRSGTHRLRAACGSDSLERTFTVFSIDDRRPACQTDDWFWTSADRFPAESGSTVTVQVGSSAPDVHIVYTIIAGDSIVESGAVERSGELLNRRFAYKEDYGNGLLLTFAWVKQGVTYQHTARLQRPLPDKRLTLAWQTFRDRLQPGQQEQWTLSIVGPDGQPARAQLMATLYDKSLEQLTAHSWALQPYIYLPMPSTAWHGGSWGGLFFSANKHKPFEKFIPLDMSRFDHDCYPSRWFVHRYGAIGGGGRLSTLRMAKQNVAIGAMSVDDAMPAAAVVEEKALSRAVVTATDVAGHDEEAADQGQAPDAVPVALRENLQETAFFMPALVADSTGQVMLRFTLPESLTTWRMLGVAHTADMMHGEITAETVAQKDVMVQPNMPRFLRQGDKASLTARVVNTTDRMLSGRACLELLDPETDAVLLREEQSVEVQPQATVGVTFAVDAAARELATRSLLVCRWTVVAGAHSDGEQHYMPVLPDSERVTVSVPFTQHQPGNKTIGLAALVPADASQPRLTVEYTNNPAWLVVQALPTMAQPGDDNAVAQAAALYANTLGSYLMQQNPKARQVFEQWGREQGSVTTLSSRLQANEELKDLVLSETLVRLRQMTGSLHDDAQEMLAAAFRYLGRDMVESVREMKRLEKKGVKPTFPSRMALEWLYVCAIDGRTLPADVTQANDYLRRLLRKEVKRQTIYEKALTAIILRDRSYVESLKQYTVWREDMGRYYDTPRAAYSWRDYRLPTQVAAIEALQRLSPADTLTISEMQRWLLQQKRTQAWDTPINSVDAIYAFLNGRPQVLAPQEKTTLTIDGELLPLSQATAGLGYVKTVVSTPHPQKLQVSKTSQGTSWGAVYAQFMQPVATIADQTGSGIRVSRQIVVPQTATQVPLPLAVGQRVSMRIVIETDRDLDFVQVTDRRAACMEPTEQLSGYRRGYYSTPRDCVTCYYFDRLPKGRHIIETEYYIDRQGTYQTGTCTVQCAYAPEFRGTAAALTLTVAE